MKRRIKFLIPLCALVLAAAAFLLLRSGVFGVSAGRVLADARAAHHIPEHWAACQSATDTVSAMLFYPPDKSDFTYSIYLNPKGRPWGFHFRAGGSDSAIQDGVYCFDPQDFGSPAYLSMNAPRVARIEFEDDNGTQAVSVDPNAPFVQVFGPGVGESSIRFFDENGGEVPIDLIRVG